jgi:hypothetical protein
MKVHGEPSVVSVMFASVIRKPIVDIFSCKLTDAENVPKGQVNTPCRYFAYDFDVAFFNKKFMHGGHHPRCALFLLMSLCPKTSGAILATPVFANVYVWVEIEITLLPEWVEITQ